MFSVARLLDGRGLPPYYTEIDNRAAFANLSSSETEYTSGDISLLVGTGSCRLEMGDIQTKIRELTPRYDVFISHGRLGDSVFPEYWIDIRTVDSAAFGDVAKGTSNMFCYGGGGPIAAVVDSNLMPGR